MPRPIIHGFKRKNNVHPVYDAWCAMKQRCLNPNRHNYKNYGGRGIKICAQWMTFEGFRIDMSASWKEGLTLNRIDNNGNYEPSNCRWATYTEQNRNQRTTKLTQEDVDLIRVVYKYGDYTHKDLAKWFGVSHKTIQSVLSGRKWKDDSPDPGVATSSPIQSGR